MQIHKILRLFEKHNVSRSTTITPQFLYHVKYSSSFLRLQSTELKFTRFSGQGEEKSFELAKDSSFRKVRVIERFELSKGSLIEDHNKQQKH